MASFQTLTVAGSTARHAGNYDLTIARGNPATSSTLLLSDFNTAHYYYADGVNSLNIATTMVENAVYDLFYMATTSSANIDITLYPNFTTYSNAFTSRYWFEPSFAEGVQTMSAFYFDHYGGSVGDSPCGRFTIHTHRTAKFLQYHGGDSSSVCIGSTRWNDTTTQWSNVGILWTGYGGGPTGNLRAFVRRVG